MTFEETSKFKYVDLFAGIGGFAAVLESLGGTCVYSVEKDKSAAKVYEQAWGHNPLGDITLDANDDTMKVPEHDILVAGFPCQPFSKSGAQKGTDETRGTLFWNIIEIVRVRRPSLVLLENVRNLVGPKHKKDWNIIIRQLLMAGYDVSFTPSVVSPHQFNPSLGGTPQVRERVFIAATLRDPNGNGREVEPINFDHLGDFREWKPSDWDLKTHLPLESETETIDLKISAAEERWLNAWEDFVLTYRKSNPGIKLPGFPLWADFWRSEDRPINMEALPLWKQNFLRKNYDFYDDNKRWVSKWLKKWGVLSEAFPPSRRKLEWQAQNADSIWDCLIQLRPSGVRVKPANYVPALVAITQTPIYGPQKRRLSIREAARLQGLPDNFNFGEQAASQSYKQLGNGVNTGVVWQVLRAHIERDKELLSNSGAGKKLLETVLNAPIKLQLSVKTK